ncbi:sulfotransferase [Rhodanobacter sp. ANJX3]|uniref:sulfotransferase family protein n=1 Tax=Rhodanobacter sp. ANJX3 TaxID=2723083 RepID=UPI001816E907|nr:sulfotransferase [Rhodanobacter sp. ANJX3]MBB5357368.1 sulfotransferase [Rhodanobacter sp. ANJX3]
MSTSTVHLISGLPRSGSTLLSALLRQNPRFNAAITSPICSLFSAVLPRMSGSAEFAPFFSDERRYRILQALFWSYHHLDPARQAQVVFDTNRSWTAKLALVDKLFPSARVICCVRDVPWVIDSVEKMVRRNPAHVSNLFNNKSVRNVYGRVDNLMDWGTGLIGLAWSSLREAWFGENANKLIVLRYESLAREPAQTMERLYRALGEQPFPHDFENVAYEEDEFDHRFGMPGLHTVKRRVEFVERATVLPPDIFRKYADSNFWMNEKLNTKGALVL